MAMMARSRSPLTSASTLHAPAVLPRNCHVARHRDGIQQPAHLVRLQNRRDANLPAESRAFDEERWVIGNDLLNYEPVKEPAQRRQVLLDGRSSKSLAFDICRDMQWPDRA